MPEDFHIELVPVADEVGPFGGKSVSEISLNGDLIIADGEFVINRSRFSLYGNLIVNGTGRLTVVDSEIGGPPTLVQDKVYGVVSTGETD